MFPIWNERGKTIAFGGRALGDVQPKYLNSAESPLYTKSYVLYALHLAREAAQKAGRNKAPLGKDRCIPPLRPATHGLCDGRLTFRHAPERSDFAHALEVGLLFEPCSLTSSELRVDQYELWADGLGLQGRDRS